MPIISDKESIAKETIILDDLSKNNHVQVLYVRGEHSTPKLYSWLEKHPEYSWMTLPELTTMGGIPLLKDIVHTVKKHQTNLSNIEEKQKRKNTIIFNTFLYTQRTKEISEISEMNTEELAQADSFFKTYVVHNPNATKFLEAVEGQNDAMVQILHGDVALPLDEAFSFKRSKHQAPHIEASFKKLTNEHYEALLGKNKELLEYAFVNELNYRHNNTFVSSSPAECFKISPVYLKGSISLLSAKTFPFFNDNGLASPLHSERLAVFPIYKHANQ